MYLVVNKQTDEMEIILSLSEQLILALHLPLPNLKLINLRRDGS